MCRVLAWGIYVRLLDRCLSGYASQVLVRAGIKKRAVWGGEKQDDRCKIRLDHRGKKEGRGAVLSVSRAEAIIMLYEPRALGAPRDGVKGKKSWTDCLSSGALVVGHAGECCKKQGP